MTNFVVSAHGVVCALTFVHRRLVFSQLGIPSMEELSDWQLHVQSLRTRKDTCRLSYVWERTSGAPGQCPVGDLKM